MSKFEKVVAKLLSGSADNNFDFKELVNVLTKLGFKLRVKGSHHIFYKEGIDEIINLQSAGGKAKPYQVKQTRNIVVKYKLMPSNED
ncbi:MAG: type II toxin-antitoxin system HicA family toxin [Cyclobacteriaceae bacterium]|nr:type II toxin-antitoxin system HicA family toxin [Cyclobacteriaceae bacterium]